jgi:hypothetical protein
MKSLSETYQTTFTLPVPIINLGYAYFLRPAGPIARLWILSTSMMSSALIINTLHRIQPAHSCVTGAAAVGEIVVLMAANGPDEKHCETHVDSWIWTRYVVWIQLVGYLREGLWE